MKKLIDELELFEHDYNEPELIPILQSALFDFTSGRCWYCGAQLRQDTLSIDHVLAFAKGGSSDTSNLVPACRRCNSYKRDLPIDEFRLLLFELLACAPFTKRQLKWLNFQNFPVYRYGKFWGEIMGLLLPLSQYIDQKRFPINYELGRCGNLNPV